MKTNVNSTIRGLLEEKLLKIEQYFKADVFCYYGNIIDGLENDIRNIIEELAQDPGKKDKLVVILTTMGGSAIAVERYVNIIRHHYSTVDFVVPDYAYSSGTIFCMSGDNIYMDYFSVLGPIDPQVQNKDGKWVGALGYLDKINEAIEKSKTDELSQVEFFMVKDLDLAELRSYEQAKDLTIQLLKKWLVKYKFKNWLTHQTTPELKGQEVTVEQKTARAEEIANMLNKNAEWNSHGRPINVERLKELGLKIDDYSINETLSGLVREYYDLLSDYVSANKQPIFVHTRKFI
ncbi:serine dehydrogenasease [Chitinophaga sp. S165]|uniref:SDH family Clp fold serine proteinase n=1 Tax=Chitinophaga sp. S165 TaxID=2135462 RepID=UPI000D71482C|nr:serine dehydrogenasease [Chitinophaga sp. S165]PWV53472.1 serine dehydrogenase proteinase [Chitinophaga sp. S165]